MKMRDGGPTRMRASAADSARQVRQDLATGGRGVPRVIDGNQSPAATPRPVTPSRRPASGYIDRQRHAEWLGGTGRTLAEPPFGSAWLTFSMIAKVSQNSGSVLWP